MEVAHLGLPDHLLCLMLVRIEWWDPRRGGSFTGGLAQKGYSRGGGGDGSSHQGGLPGRAECEHGSVARSQPREV